MNLTAIAQVCFKLLLVCTRTRTWSPSWCGEHINTANSISWCLPLTEWSRQQQRCRNKTYFNCDYITSKKTDKFWSICPWISQNFGCLTILLCTYSRRSPHTMVVLRWLLGTAHREAERIPAAPIYDTSGVRRAEPFVVIEAEGVLRNHHRQPSGGPCCGKPLRPKDWRWSVISSAGGHDHATQFPLPHESSISALSTRKGEGVRSDGRATAGRPWGRLIRGPRNGLLDDRIHRPQGEGSTHIYSN